MTPVIGTVLTATLVVIVSSPIVVVALGIGPQVDAAPPTVAFESEVDENVILQNGGGISGSVNDGSTLHLPPRATVGGDVTNVGTV